ncbi:type VI secretion protein VasK [Pandoraea terrae]|uniref:Type VI secretion protein VasK n=1 Tax=Pandoraea terrae TaxID=1537710 RepID=A0A5E4ZGS0_9BURK|nr:type VI secretion protein VasK [Pandoraea terrae]
MQYQAHSGRPSQSLSDTLVRRAQDLLQGADPDPAELVPSGIATAPLDESFGPLLALMGDAGNAAAVPGATPRPAPANDVSLARYLTRVTTVRLKLQQIAASPQPQAMARSLAQAVFQGQLSDLMQARDDAGVTAASLGQQWAGFGHALFAQPLDMAWQTILAPAAASLNASWREGIAMPFSIAFNGRYPFADTTADASFAELGRYVRPDTGLIARFVATQLAGVLVPQGERWVPNPLVPQSLRIDPAFLAALNQLSALGAQGYLRGDAGYRFELMALPAVDVTRTELVIDGRPIVYFNQRESWTPIAWPGDGLNGRASLRWHTVNAGARQAFDATGDWAFLRLLEKAQTTPLDSTRYALTWQQPGAQDLQYVLRTQTGAGPLDLLGLRGFKMPERIFAVDPSAGAHATASTPSPGAAR